MCVKENCLFMFHTLTTGLKTYVFTDKLNVYKSYINGYLAFNNRIGFPAIKQ